LEWKRALLEAQLDASVDGLLVVDADRKTALANKRLIEFYKIPRYILEGEDSTCRLNYLANRAKHPEWFFEMVMDINVHPHLTSRDVVEFKSGRMLDLYSTPVLGKDGHYYRRLWTFRDITEQKQTEDALIAKKSAISWYNLVSAWCNYCYRS
jgi:PAS domain-containing protein